MYVRVVTPPAEEIITLERARLQCKIDADQPVPPATEATSERDPEIMDAIATARELVQDYVQRAIGQQTVELVMTGWPSSVWLPLAIVQSIVSVKYDGDGGEQALPEAAYSLRGGERAVVDFYSTPRLASKQDNVRIRYVAGYTKDTLPRPVKSAMLLLIADLVQNVSRQVERPLAENAAFCRLLAPYRLGLGV
jgi:uncharacterized phiE125 gp8 family phage protein